MASVHHFRLHKNHRVWGTVVLHSVAKGTPAALPVWVREAIAAAWPQIKPYPKAPWALGLRVVEADEAIAANTQFRSKTYAPDVLSFPLWEGEGTRVYAGDILLCWPTLKAAATAQGKPIKAHVQHLVVHALLHVAGYDHLTPQDAAQMEALEIKLLAGLSVPNPYEID
jgi:probable rRNA maturation factor